MLVFIAEVAEQVRYVDESNVKYGTVLGQLLGWGEAYNDELTNSTDAHLL